LNNRIVTIAIVAAIGVGFGAGYWFSTPALVTTTGGESLSSEPEVLFWRNPMNPAITSPVFAQDEMGMDYLPVYAEEKKPKEKTVLFWRNPMNPEITSSVFAQDEMGMDYLPVYADGADESADAAVVGTVSIDPVTVQNIGVRTVEVERRTLAREFSALGRVDFNEKRLARLHPKTSGWIESLRIDETGVQVKRDTILLSIYAPDLVTAQQEFLIALSNWETLRSNSAKRVLDSTRERLELFDVPAHQIKQLEQSRKITKLVHIHSPFQGAVMNIDVRVGQYISPKDELYLIADLNRIWVNVDVFEDKLAWLKVGDTAKMRVRAVPGRNYQGKVTFIHPVLNSKSRTVQVRLEFDNADLALKPGMFANVIFYADPQPDAVVVPNEAIIRSGSREQVFVLRGAGKFEPRLVTLGISADGVTQILDGVKPGEWVVSSGQFLIDSESKLREATAKMMAVIAGGKSRATTDMTDMDTTGATAGSPKKGAAQAPQAETPHGQMEQ